MAKSKGMHADKDRKTRGRTSITGTVKKGPDTSGGGPQASKPNVPQTLRTETNRPVGNNGLQGKHRGDRRDMSKTYTNNSAHKSRGNNPRTDVRTRKR